MGLFDFIRKSKEEEKQTLDQGLEKTKTSLFQKITKSILGKSTVDDEVLDNLEETLVTSDVGVETTLKIIDHLRNASNATAISPPPSSILSSKPRKHSSCGRTAATFLPTSTLPCPRSLTSSSSSVSTA